MNLINPPWILVNVVNVPIEISESIKGMQLAIPDSQNIRQKRMH